MSISTIHQVLNDHLQSMGGLPALQLENTRNVGKTGVPFCRATLITSRPSTLTVGTTGQDILRGLYQIDLFFPQDTGVSDVNALADQIIEHFPRGLMFSADGTALHVNTTYRETGRRVDAFYQAPVVVAWTCIV